jgi:hypothetical protein
MARSDDRGATQAYLRATYAEAHVEAVDVNASIAAIDGEAAGIKRECPSALVNAPHGKQLNELAEEMSAAVLFSGAAPDQKAILLFARRIAGLRWSSRRITRLVEELASEERVIAGLVVPDVCADIKAWVASGYRTLPRDTAGFLKQTDRIGKGVGAKKEESVEEAVLRLLKPYESSHDRRLVRHIERLEETTGKKVLHVFAAIVDTGRALGLLKA